MITEQKPKNLPSTITAPIKPIPSNFKKAGSLRRRLLVAILPTVLVPLAISSLIGYIMTEGRVKNHVVEKLESDTFLASKIITAFINDSFELTDEIAANPDVIRGMKVASNQVQQQQLVQQPISELEKEFAASKSLATDDHLIDHLQQIAKSDRVTEIFLTERYGFNFVSSNTTSDFVQRDEGWWQYTQKNGQWFDEPEFDESVKTNVMGFSQAVQDPQTNEFLGVIRTNITLSSLNSELVNYLHGENAQEAARFQIVDPDASFVLNDISYRDIQAENENGQQSTDGDEESPEYISEDIPILGGEPIIQAVKTLIKVEDNDLTFEALEPSEADSFLTLEEAQQSITQQPGFSEVSFHQETIFSKNFIAASFRYRNNIYSLVTVPHTDIVSIGVINYDVVAATGRNLLKVAALGAVILGIIATGSIILLAQQLSRPLTRLSENTQQVAAGNLNVTASIEGTLETRTLADNFNKLVNQVKELLQKQKILADEQRQEKEQLEQAIYTLIEEISDATEGDLTVRANLNSLELSTVADLFNAIIDSLQEIAIETKQSTRLVGSSLKHNEAAIRLLAGQAMTEAAETQNTLISAEEMSQSIQAVSKSASQAEKIADDTYNTVLNSTKDMDSTVNSILNLRTTVGETAKKMKRLGESSQKISQAVFFIEEIALKTNVLAINASVEAGRAGEYGQGFTIVAEQVGALAEQSATATKEIARIVATIQAETQEVSQAMESGTTQVVDSTRLVESTKQSLAQVLQKSQQINQLMSFISQATGSQADTSQNVTNLMQKIAQLSETTAKSSQEIAQSMVETAQVAKKLESAVAQFKVAENRQ
ncbi:MAG: methyl-accepting chemotaxis protein [Pleurocapsa sp. MO_192.B19]|nr:methyl-accepting chemotaxis protein [Pleurocapsa sp. MO_192.B19]